MGKISGLVIVPYVSRYMPTFVHVQTHTHTHTAINIDIMHVILEQHHFGYLEKEIRIHIFT